jgi:hypothetical protein
VGFLDALSDGGFRSDAGRGLIDAGNRGVVGGLLGYPVDAMTGVLNAGLMGAGLLGHETGLLSAEQLPQPITNPVGGSEWIGQGMQDAGFVSPQRNPLAEFLATAAAPGALGKAGRALTALDFAVTDAPALPVAGRLNKQAGVLFPKSRARITQALQSGDLPERMQVGDVTGGQNKGVSAYYGGKEGPSDVYVDRDTLQHLIDRRINGDGFTPEEVVKFIQQAMEPRAKAFMNPAKIRQRPGLMNPGQIDPVTKLRYTALLPLRRALDGFDIATIIPKGLPARNNKAP